MYLDIRNPYIKYIIQPKNIELFFIFIVFIVVDVFAMTNVETGTQKECDCLNLHLDMHTCRV